VTPVIVENTASITSSTSLYANQYLAQSFLTAQQETIASIVVWVGEVSGAGGTLQVRLGTSADLSTYVSSGSITIGAGHANSAVTLVLDTPYVATAGTWFFGLVGPATYANRLAIGRTANVYPDGAVYVGAGWPGTASSSDAYFKVQR